MIQAQKPNRGTFHGRENIRLRRVSSDRELHHAQLQQQRKRILCRLPLYARRHYRSVQALLDRPRLRKDLSADMSENRGTLETLAGHLIAAMEPLRRAFTSEQSFKAFLLRLGLQTAGLPPAYASVASAVDDAVQALEGLSDSPSLNDILALVGKSKTAFDAIQNISTAPPGVDAGAFLSEIGERLFELLLTDYLAAEQAAAFNLLSALNVIELENLPATKKKTGYMRT